MAKYIRKSSEVDAVRWLKKGDHPSETTADSGGWLDYLRLDNGDLCACGHSFASHGYINSPCGEDFYVCPGDWIITRADGSMFICRDTIFRAAYERSE